MTLQAHAPKDLQEIVDLVKTSEISSIRNAVSGLLRVLNDPESNVKDIKDLIEIDPPLTAQVLKVANSAYYSPPSRIGEILKAVLWIGFEAVKELALNRKLCEVFKDDTVTEDFSRLSLWKHSVGVAVMGKMIYRRELGEKGENIYAAGLLHDIGIIVEDQFCHDRFLEVLQRSKKEGRGFTAMENMVFGFNHAELGKAVMASWDMPEELCEAIGQHHEPAAESATQHARISCVLYIADALCREKQIGHSDGSTSDKTLLHRCMEETGIEGRGLDLIINDVEEQITHMETQGLFG